MPKEQFTLTVTANNAGTVTNIYERTYKGTPAKSWGDYANEAVGNDILNWLSRDDTETVTIELS